MNVSQLKPAIRLCRRAGVTIFIWGHRGMGKSSSVRQITSEDQMGFVDFRASQIESSDLRGLPDRKDGRTIYFPPEDLPHGEYKCLECEAEILSRGGLLHNSASFGENGSFSITGKVPDRCPKGHTNKGDEKVIILHEGILFLDELNRADDDVLQASFQLVLDRRLGRYVLPTGWSVAAAGNYQQGYMVNSFNDPAFLDRFCHVQLTKSKDYVADWSEYMSKLKSASGVNDRILQFVGFEENHLMGKVEGDLGFTIMSSPRSWEMVAKVMTEAETNSYPKEVVREVLQGIVGMELATAFERFSVEVMPQDVLNKGVKAVEGKLRSFNRNQLVGLVWGVASHAKERFTSDKGKEKESMVGHTLDFMEWVAKNKERDLAVMLGKSLVDKETVNLSGAILANPNLAKMAAKYKGTKGDSWIAAINDRPDLQQLMSKVSYGT